MFQAVCERGEERREEKRENEGREENSHVCE
jgi:hypothetical protein